MLWDDEVKKTDFVVPDNVVDLLFKISCKQLPTSHAWELSQAMNSLLPWLIDEPEVGLHQIHGATSGNGWQGPADGELFYLSKRTRMEIRIPRARLDETLALVGKKLDIAGFEVVIGQHLERRLSPLTTLFSRYVIVPDGLDEDSFTQWVADELAKRDIKLRKMLCGMTHIIQTPEKDLETRSIMIADLDKETSIALQQQGIGEHRQLGCGIFVPHKGIAAVGETEDKSHFSGT